MRETDFANPLVLNINCLTQRNLLSRIITYPGLSSEDLEQLSRVLAQNSQALTESDKKLLDLLDAQPMTSKETKYQNNRTRNGGWGSLDVTPIDWNTPK